MDDRDLDRRLRAYESRLPETDAPNPRGIRPRRGIRWPALAGVLGAAMIVGAVGGAVLLQNRPSAPTGELPPITSPSAAGVEELTLDTPRRDCPGNPDQLLAVYRIPDGEAFWTLFPEAGRTPELAAVQAPLLVVVYDGRYVGSTFGGFGSPMPSAPTSGTADVCVETVDGSKALASASYGVYPDIPLPTQLAVASPEPTFAAQSTPPGSTGPVAAKWQLETLPDAVGPVQIKDVAILPDGRAIVVGADARAGGEGTIEPAAWYDDGAGNWTRAEVSAISDLGDFPSAFQLGPVVATDDGLASIGIGESGAVIYTSTDSGVSWNRQFAVGDPINESGGGIEGFVLDVERGPSGYVAVGHLGMRNESAGSAAMIWTSADALHWQPVGDALGVGAIGAGIVGDVTVGHDVLLAVGSAWDEDGTHPRGAVWSSTDGDHWTEIDPGDDIGGVASVLGTPDGFLLGGAASDSVGGSQAAAWFSPDGDQWESAALTPGRIRGVSGLAATGSGFVAIGDRADHAAAWWSMDGHSWAQMSDLETDGRSIVIAVASSGDTVLIAGTIEPGGEARQPAVWRTQITP